MLVAVPLRTDVKNPLWPKSDEAPIGDKPEEKKEEPRKKSQEGRAQAGGAQEGRTQARRAQEGRAQARGAQEGRAQARGTQEGRAQARGTQEGRAQARGAEEGGTQARGAQERNPRRKSRSPCRSIWTGSCCGRSRCRSRPGGFSQLCVNAGGQLIYARRGMRGTEDRRRSCCST